MTTRPQVTNAVLRLQKHKNSDGEEGGSNHTPEPIVFSGMSERPQVSPQTATHTMWQYHVAILLLDKMVVIVYR